MRAVNLIPVEERRGGAGAPGRSGAGVYVLLGVLGALVLAVAAYALSVNAINQRKAELARVSEQADAVEAQARALKPYRDFATLRQKRIETVTALAASRFDWERTMRQLARVLPADISLTSFTATVAPGKGGPGTGTGAAGTSVRGAVNSPAIELVGCARSQSEVSRVMSRLRRMTGVTRVTLSSSEKSDQQAGMATAAPGAGAGAGSDCRAGNPNRPQFNITVFFAAPAGMAPSAPGAPAPGSPPAAGGGTQPVSSTSQAGRP